MFGKNVIMCALEIYKIVVIVSGKRQTNKQTSKVAPIDKPDEEITSDEVQRDFTVNLLCETNQSSDLIYEKNSY